MSFPKIFFSRSQAEVGRDAVYVRGVRHTMRIRSTRFFGKYFSSRWNRHRFVVRIPWFSKNWGSTFLQNQCEGHDKRVRPLLNHVRNSNCLLFCARISRSLFSPDSAHVYVLLLLIFVYHSLSFESNFMQNANVNLTLYKLYGVKTAEQKVF